MEYGVSKETQLVSISVYVSIQLRSSATQHDRGHTSMQARASLTQCDRQAFDLGSNLLGF